MESAQNNHKQGAEAPLQVVSRGGGLEQDVDRKQECAAGVVATMLEMEGQLNQVVMQENEVVEPSVAAKAVEIEDSSTLARNSGGGAESTS